MAENEPSTTKPSRRRKAAAAPAEEPKDTRTATIQTTAMKTRAVGFTFGKGYVVPVPVPIAHAQFLQEQKQADILEVHS